MKKPNVIIILNDDMGYSDIGCYGGEASTPTLDKLAANGLKFSQFYNSPRCSPTRASLLTGLHPHQTGVGLLTDNQSPDGYEGNLNRSCVTIAEVLKDNGYGTYMSGKWHVCNEDLSNKINWPTQRGFDEFYGIITGASDYYYPITLTRNNDNIESEAKEDPDYYLTDAISQNAVDYIEKHNANNDDPFFMYVAYTAPHWPLQAPQENIDKYKGRFDRGWDKLRQERLSRMIDLGLVDAKWKLTDRDESQQPWEDVENKEWEAQRMTVYAAQIDRMDQGIAKIMDALEKNDITDNTLVIFLADNGGCAEELLAEYEWLNDEHIARKRSKDGKRVAIGNYPNVMPGDQYSYQSYGIPWANVSNTPFRLYKHWTHEGGISTPFIMHWPEGIKAKGELRHSPAQLTDIMATVLDVTGARYPVTYNGNDIIPLEGESLKQLFDGDTRERGMLFWEHEGNEAVRFDKWKLVKRYSKEYELYDMELDRTETQDVSAHHPEIVNKMKQAYDEWATRCDIIPREIILGIDGPIYFKPDDKKKN